MHLKRADLHMNDAEIAAFLRSNIWGRLATANLSAQPHVTPIGYVFHDEAIYFYTIRKSRRGRDLAENDQATLLVDDGVGPGEAYTKRRGVIVYGRCTMLDKQDPMVATVHAEFERVMGAENSGDLARQTHAWYRLQPVKFVSWDFRKIPLGVDRTVDRVAAKLAGGTP